MSDDDSGLIARLNLGVEAQRLRLKHRPTEWQ